MSHIRDMLYILGFGDLKRGKLESNREATLRKRLDNFYMASCVQTSTPRHKEEPWHVLITNLFRG